MKTIQYFFFMVLATVLMAADCSNKDSEFYNDVFVKAPNLIEIETQSNYSVNDILWLNSDSFSRYLVQPNTAKMLDSFKTTSGALSYNFSYVIEKQVTGDEWAAVVLGSNLINQKGNSTEDEDFVNGTCVYNETTKNYDFRSGIKLTQTGVYRLSFGYNSTSTTGVELRSNSTNNNLYLNIDSNVAGLNGDGYYLFSVN